MDFFYEEWDLRKKWRRIKKEGCVSECSLFKSQKLHFYSNREHFSKRVAILTNTNTKILQILKTKTNTLFTLLTKITYNSLSSSKWCFKKLNNFDGNNWIACGLTSFNEDKIFLVTLFCQTIELEPIIWSPLLDFHWFSSHGPTKLIMLKL